MNIINMYNTAFQILSKYLIQKAFKKYSKYYKSVQIHILNALKDCL